MHRWSRKIGQDLIHKTPEISFWRPFSPWHDIPLYTSKATYLNYVNEIPRGSRAKMEISTQLEANPIVQDRKNDKPRFYHTPSLVNYGCLPQTWENPVEKDPQTQLLGDNDPLDVCEIGERVHECGEIYQVKVLGVLGMIDEGEMDWKIIAIDAEDPLAERWNDVNEIESKIVSDLHDWFRDYKIPDGKPPNTFAFEGQAQNQAFALDVIRHNHNSWQLKYGSN